MDRNLKKVLSFNAPAFEIIKSYRDENGQMFIEGIAATTAIDLTGERMSPEVLHKMALGLVGKPLRSEHGRDWDDKLGEIVKADVVEQDGKPALWIKARLFDWLSKAKDLFGFLKQEGTKMGLSVAGKINPGGLVKEMVTSAGKYVPTYRDVQPTEVSITDHPANLDTFAYAVSKSLNLDEYDPSEFTKEKVQEIKQEVEKDADTQRYQANDIGDFLDPENNMYPADAKHVLPLLRYYNTEGHREEDGYDNNKWGQMGFKLAAKLTHLTGDAYTYDDESEKVVKKSVGNDEKEVITDMEKGKLVSKNVSDDVKRFAREWGKDVDTEVKKTEVKKADEVKKVEEKVEKDSSSSDSGSSSTGSQFTLGGKDSSSSDSSSSSSSGGISSILSELKSTLEAINSSLSSGSSSGSSGSSSSSDSSSGSDKTSTDKSLERPSSQEEANGKDQNYKAGKTSTDKAEETESDENMARAVDQLVEAASTMRELIAKKKGGKEGKPAAGPHAGSASDYSSSDNVTGTKPTSYNVGKSADVEAFTEMVKTLRDIQKSLAERDEEFKKAIVEKAKPAERKGYAIAMEKKFVGHEEVQDSPASEDLLEKMAKDSEVNFAEFHKYRDYGILPAKYAKQQGAAAN